MAFREYSLSWASTKGIGDQVAEHRLVAVQPGDEALAGAGDDGLADQALLVEAVAQAFLRLIGVVAQQPEQVVGVEKVAQTGERRVGFDQVLGACATGLSGTPWVQKYSGKVQSKRRDVS
ncbi:hypothetical protein DNK44_17015 [Pseudomonas dryadis]|uniref:Uncharacterized protein n=1 Tax=Phytopseudomonas dryadis TaxID=2487520 RepID=A0A4Q9QYH1_9GAMM|nr:hypothetical protein [Pseudomonas dryadis]TBU89203.1 hypothetical protein DNK44_17015 [Pseudomonas dryadis]